MPGRKRRTRSAGVQRCTSKTYLWSLREKKTILAALKKYGFNDTSKIAAEVKTKSQSEVEYFIEKWSLKVQALSKQEIENIQSKAHSQETISKQLDVGGNTIPSTEYDDSDNQTASQVAKEQLLVKWNKVLLSSMSQINKSQDYSIILSDIFGRYAEEQLESNHPEIPNFKAVYKYIQDAMKGDLPAQLAPLDSAVMDLLMHDLSDFEKTYDMEGEKKFLKGFLGPLKFILEGTEIKQEGKTQSLDFDPDVKSEPGTSSNLNSIAIPDFFYEDYRRHEKVKDNINPLIVHHWLLQKEQEKINEYFEKIYKDNFEKN